MKNKALKHLMMSGIVGLVVAGINFAAQATPIQGSIDFDGAATLNGTLGNATSFNSMSGPNGPDPIVLDGNQISDYGTVPGGTPAVFTPFAFDGAQTVPFTLWTFTVGSTIYSFVINSIDPVVVQNSNFLQITGDGTAQITGFDDTPGTWTITDTSADPNAASVTLSASFTVPECTNIGCFLFSLCALACFQHLRKSHSV